MRRFELVLLFVSLFAVAWPAIFGVRPRRGIVSVFLAGALAAQLQIEGFRWQMIPLYLVAAGLATGDIVFIERTLSWTSRVARGVFGVGGVLVAASIPMLLLPVPELPVPPGPESIGTITLQLTDPDRREQYGPNPGGPRTFVAQVWYPASGRGEPQLWSEEWDVVAPALASRMGLPSWFLNHTRFTSSHAVESLPPVEGNFPIVIYSHGWTGFRSIAINQIESLVSNGYVVIAPDHTHGAVATRLVETGEVIEYDPAALPDPQTVTEEVYEQAAGELIATFAGDLATILDELDLGEDGRFAPIVANADLTRIGIYGHSAGGGAAVQLCLEDERCDATAGLDPWVEPLPDNVLRLTSTRPAMYIRSEEWAGTENDAVLRGIAGRSEESTYWIGIGGTGHNDFVVTPFLSPIAGRLGLRGSIPAGRVVPIVDNYLLGFFDVFLLGTGSAALDTVTFDEATVEVINP